MTAGADADRAAIARASAALLAAVNAGDVDGVLAAWGDDGVLMPPHHPSVRGRAALAEYFRALFARRRLRFAFTSSEISLDGDLAVERVTYAASAWPAAGGPATDDAGKGVHVYRRAADGGWRLVHDIWSSDRPA